MNRNGNGENGFSGMVVILMVLAALLTLLVWTSGCHIHLLGRYYVGEQQDTVLLETNDEETQGQADNNWIGADRRDNHSLLVTPD
ncbi:MAG: hypothetical protein V3V96_14305 [Acidiferrobacterales bacterium]